MSLCVVYQITFSSNLLPEERKGLKTKFIQSYQEEKCCKFSLHPIVQDYSDGFLVKQGIASEIRYKQEVPYKKLNTIIYEQFGNSNHFLIKQYTEQNGYEWKQMLEPVRVSTPRLSGEEEILRNERINLGQNLTTLITDQEIKSNVVKGLEYFIEGEKIRNQEVNRLREECFNILKPQNKTETELYTSLFKEIEYLEKSNKDKDEEIIRLKNILRGKHLEFQVKENRQDLFEEDTPLKELKKTISEQEDIIFKLNNKIKNQNELQKEIKQLQEEIKIQKEKAEDNINEILEMKRIQKEEQERISNQAINGLKKTIFSLNMKIDELKNNTDLRMVEENAALKNQLQHYKDKVIELYGRMKDMVEKESKLTAFAHSVRGSYIDVITRSATEIHNQLEIPSNVMLAQAQGRLAQQLNLE